MVTPRFLAIADVQRILMSTPPGGDGRITFGSGDGDTMSADDANTFISEAEDLVEAKLGQKLTAPTTLVKGAMARLAACMIWKSAVILPAGSEIPEPVQDWCNFPDQVIKALKGGIQPEATAPVGIGVPSSSEYLDARDEEVTLTGVTYISLAMAEILQGTEWARSTRTGGTTYTRGTDFNLFYRTGEIQRIDGGAIADGGKIFIDYSYRLLRASETPKPTVEITSIGAYVSSRTTPPSSKIWPR